jgi:hypothetical protein
MKENFWYRDPLASGHAAADRILEKQKQEAEMAAADNYAEETKPVEAADVEFLEPDDEKENPSEEYYRRFEQFKGIKNHPAEASTQNKKKKVKSKYPPHRSPRAFDPYK